jgi:hypothetical protein
MIAATNQQSTNLFWFSVLVCAIYPKPAVLLRFLIPTLLGTQ